MIAVALAAALTLVIAGGAFAFYTFDPFHVFRPGPQAAVAVPANAVAYVGVDLDPMATQKVDAMRFLNAFPGLREQAGMPKPGEDVREVAFDAIMRSAKCANLSFAKDVSPWLGSRMGYAMLAPSGRDKEPAAVILQVSDQDAARLGIQAVDRCAAGSSHPEPVGIAFSHGFAIVTQHQWQATAYASSVAANGSLADDDQFKADMASLGDPGIVSAWADVRGLVRAFAPTLMTNQSIRPALAETQRVAATFRFRSDAVELATSTYGKNFPVAHGYNPIIRLPESTVLAMSESGADQRVGRMWNQSIAQVQQQDPFIDRQLTRLQRQTGLLLPDDLKTLFGR